MFNVCFPYLKISLNYFLFFSYPIRIYERKHEKCKMLLNYHTIRKAF